MFAIAFALNGDTPSGQAVSVRERSPPSRDEPSLHQPVNVANEFLGAGLLRVGEPLRELVLARSSIQLADVRRRRASKALVERPSSESCKAVMTTTRFTPGLKEFTRGPVEREDLEPALTIARYSFVRAMTSQEPDDGRCLPPRRRP